MKKKITALVLAIGLLLMAQPALAQGEPLPTTTIPSDPRGEAKGGSEIKVTFMLPSYTLVIPKTLAFGDTFWAKQQHYTKDFEVSVFGMAEDALKLGYAVAVKTSGSGSGGAYTLEKGSDGPTIAYTVKNGTADIPANSEFGSFKRNNTPQTGTVTLNAPTDSANVGQYQGNLVFSAALVPPTKTTP